MTVFEARLRIEVPADRAWSALEAMGDWLPRLSTVRAVEPDVSGPRASPDGSGANSLRLRTGLCYLTRTSEGATMRCRVMEADRSRGRVRIAATLGPLRSRLLCAVEQDGPDACTLVRRQDYPGPVGRVFTWLFRAREQAETAAYLRVWADEALAGSAGRG